MSKFSLQLATGQGASKNGTSFTANSVLSKNVNLKISIKGNVLYKSFKIYICIIFFLFYLLFFLPKD